MFTDVHDYIESVIEHGIATESEIILVTSLLGTTTETIDSILFTRTGYRSWAQYTDSE